MNSLSPESENPGSQLSLFSADQVIEQAPAPEAPAPRRSRRRTTDPAWPPHERFPYNNPHTGHTVGERVLKELRASRRPLIITGYTSLPLVIDLLAHYRSQSCETHGRLLLGHEPRPIERSTYRVPGPQTFSRELEDYWLNQGISVYQSAAVLAAIDFLQTGSIEVRISGNPKHPVHAKIYQADHAITLGSSNLSHNGMYTQFEANERHEVFDGERFVQACALAEQIWATGRDYRQQLIALLQRLLSAVSWQESLARACAEVLDGHWARRYTLADPLVNAPQLWPAQVQGLVQAIWLVDQVGSVLVADATGSGKTRLGAEILRAMTNRLWERGRVRNHIPVIVAPPRVLADWERDTTAINLPSERYPHSLLSRAPGETHQARQDVLQRAQVLAIDEAHNFLNTTSNRSRALLRCAPEHTLLLTATPLNRELSDLLTIINLLGPDNFDDHIIELVLQAAQVRPSARGKDTKALPISTDDIALLQRAIRQFMLRRTKRQFNALIDQEPEAYRNRLGKPCRYPETRAHYYETGETAEDQRWITAIRRALDQMTGMAFVHKVLRVPDSPRWRKHPDPERAWVTSMVQSAKALAGYHVLAALRSSRIAALEHLFGTHAAWRECVGDPVPLKQAAQTGNLYERVQRLGGKLPVNMLELTDLPAILTDPESHRRACEHDAQIYDAIGRIIRKISDQRETTKARLIADLIERHSLLIAFDARPITLHDIARRLEHDRIQIRIATAERTQDCRKVMQEFRLGSQASRIVALCTDAMSESINLQAASTIVHLDLPTVVRRLEQRDGRLSRMDSDHREVESWLPQDSPAFAPTSGEELIYRRYRMVETLLGGNVVLPDSPALADPEEEDPESDDTPPAAPDTLITPERIVQNRDQREQILDAIPDAFSPVRSLVIGDQALVSRAIYEHYRRGQARVVSSVAAVRAEKPWVFLCLAGSDTGAPRFVLMSSCDTAPKTGLEEICEQLRSWLGPHTPQRSFDRTAAEQLTAYLEQLNEQDELLLPRKKQRALAEMRAILPSYRPKRQRRRGKADEIAEPDDASTRRIEVVDALLDLLNNRGERRASDGRRITPDLGILADRWLYLIRPAWTEVARSSRRKILLLRDLREYLRKHPPETAELEQLLYEEGLWVRPLDERVVAAIVGVPDEVV